MKVFVLSTGRTGTLFIADAFARLGVSSHHEPGPGWLRNVSNARASGRISHESAVIAWQRVRGNIEGVDRYLEASCLVYGLAEEILEVHADALVVHLVRDPRTYLKSAMDWGVQRLGGRPLNALPFRRLAPPQRRPWSLTERWRWATAPRFDRIAWGWTHMNEAIRLACQGRERTMTIKFEDLTDRDHSGLRAVALAGGLVADESQFDVFDLAPVNASKSERGGFPPWQEWTAAQRETLVRLCGEEALRYGYDLSQGEL